MRSRVAWISLSIVALIWLATSRPVVRWIMTSGAPEIPTGVEFSYADADRFAAAIARLDTTVDTAAVLHDYLRLATPGFEAYAGMFGVSEGTLLAAIRRRPLYYRSLRDLPQRLRGQEPRVRDGLAALERLYGPTVFPKVWFVVGTGRAGGQPSRQGILVGADVYAASADPGERESVLTPRNAHVVDDLAALIVHETVHFNQSAGAPFIYFRQWNNLARALKEGSADFMAELATGGHINRSAHAYGESHERALWRQFSKTLEGSETDPWFFTRPADDRPADLGYFLGYRVVRAYYARAADPAQAVRAIMELRDYSAFLEQSAYEP